MKTQRINFIKPTVLAGALLAAQMAGAASITVTSTADSGPGTLRDALATAVGGDTIDATGVSGTILLMTGELLVTNSVTILGPGPANLAVDGNAVSRVFHIGSNTVVSIASLTVTNGFLPDAFPYVFGGGIYNDHATLTISNSIISGNSAVRTGGGIANDGGTLTIVNSALRGNSTPAAGIFNLGSNSGSPNNNAMASVINCTFTGNAGTAIFNLGASLTVVHSTLTTNGNISATGGGIYSLNGRVMVTDCVLHGNVAAVGGAIYNAIYNSGSGGNSSMQIANCVVTGNSAGTGGAGGGIYNSAPLTIAGCTISGNSAAGEGGGGIANYGTTLVISNSTINGNIVSGPIGGGGIFNSGGTLTIGSSTLSDNFADSGAGIENFVGTLTVGNCTISSNSASGFRGGGGIINFGMLAIVGSTFSGNSASTGGCINNEGLFGNTKLEIGSTILNAGASGGTIVNNDSGTVISLGYNLSSDDAGGFLDQPSDILNTDPMLGPLQDNGGPTFTHALFPGSPAIDRGLNFSGLANDQRGSGFVRMFDDPSIPNASGGDGTDIGAFEVQPPPCTTIVTTTADNGPGSLRAALACAQDGDTVDATGVSGTILLTSGELLVTNSVTIIGPGPNHLAVDGNAASRVFHIGSNTVVSISSLTVTNGNSGSGKGGGIDNDHATLTVSNCTVSGNSASSFGGGIGNDGDGGSATLTVADTTVSRNSVVNGHGGGIWHIGGMMTVVNSTVVGNKGNGISAGYGSVVVVNSTVSSNSAFGTGGGIEHSGGTMTVVNSIVSDNFSLDDGGGFFNGFEFLTVSNCTIIGNSALNGFGGGGICNAGGAFGGGVFNATMSIANSTISSNSATYGGGIYNEAFEGSAGIEILGSTLNGNLAGADGGGIFNQGQEGGYASLQILNSTFSGNSASSNHYGGDILNNGSAHIFNSTLNGGSAGTGGGLCNGSDALDLKIGSTILNAGTSGGNITIYGGTVTSLGFNLSSDGGGGFLTNTTDQINTDPMLGPLQDNGGPTFTHALLCGSPAVDRGFNFSGTASDQRGIGFTRTFDDSAIPNAPGGDGTDIGAFEVQTACNNPPVASCKNVSVPAGPGESASASIDGGSFDPDPGDTIILTQVPAGPYPVGDTTVTLTVTDSHGASDFCTATVHVQGAAEQIQDLIALVQNFGLPPGTANSLIVKLQAAASALDRNNTQAACGTLGAFLNEVTAQKGKKLTAAQADSLLAEAVRIRTILKCP